ncbi:MAG: hypothetical protein ACLGIO_05405, partial [Acidimicrobiia bacterium]
MPRSRNTVGRHVELLAVLMTDDPGDDSRRRAEGRAQAGSAPPGMAAGSPGDGSSTSAPDGGTSG